MSPLALLQTGSLILFALLLVAAAWQDLHTLHIADASALAIAATFLLWAVAGLAAGTVDLSGMGLAAACALGLFGIGALAFAAGGLGGGDVKLLAAAGLFAGPTLMVDFLLVTALVGGLLGVAILSGAPIGPAAPTGHGTLRARLRGKLPYGPAIAAGGLWVAAALAPT